MFSVIVLYGWPDDVEAFDRHYAEVHTPLARKIPGLKRFDATTIEATPDGSPPPYRLVVTLTFNSPQDAQAGLQSAEGQAATADVANFATGGATGLLGPTQFLA